MTSPLATRARMQDLAAAILAGGDPEDTLEMVLARAKGDLAAATAMLVLPFGADAWSIELADGEDVPLLLGRDVPLDSDLGRALARHDGPAAEGVDGAGASGIEDLLDGQAGRPRIVRAVDAGEDGIGLLIVTGHDDAEGALSIADPVGEERVSALAALVGFALTPEESGADSRSLDDERGRIARDLHDLAIQELFAVGMELESLQASLEGPDAVGLSPEFAQGVKSSVSGVERAVAQIRQIVQSLRRDRPEATLTEQLRHEVGLATAGLGYAPSLRLPKDSASFDAEVPQEIAEDVVAVVRESLANAARHAHASAVAVVASIFSEGVDRVVQVSVSDNGRGIDPSITRRSGLANMASRARRHSGWVDAIPLEPGTMISWRVTLPPA